MIFNSNFGLWELNVLGPGYNNEVIPLPLNEACTPVSQVDSEEEDRLWYFCSRH